MVDLVVRLAPHLFPIPWTRTTCGDLNHRGVMPTREELISLRSGLCTGYEVKDGRIMVGCGTHSGWGYMDYRK
uniref:Uncharacterized protein n=1 Tax=Oryza rufipogon TaxID=4529 RepID=A0A0E0R6V6_ORYRU